MARERVKASKSTSRIDRISIGEGMSRSRSSLCLNAANVDLRSDLTSERYSNACLSVGKASGSVHSKGSSHKRREMPPSACSRTAAERITFAVGEMAMPSCVTLTGSFRWLVNAASMLCSRPAKACSNCDTVKIRTEGIYKNNSDNASSWDIAGPFRRSQGRSFDRANSHRC